MQPYLAPPFCLQLLFLCSARADFSPALVLPEQDGCQSHYKLICPSRLCSARADLSILQLLFPCSARADFSHALVPPEQDGCQSHYKLICPSRLCPARAVLCPSRMGAKAPTAILARAG